MTTIDQVRGNLKGSELANLCPDAIGEAEEIVLDGSVPSATTLRPRTMTAVRAVVDEAL
jgi:hypothetical protein